MEEIDGRPVTDEMIQQWADEAERGYDPEVLRKRGRPTIGEGPATVVPVRMDAGMVAAIAEVAERDHTSRSEVVRAAVRAWLGDAA